MPPRRMSAAALSATVDSLNANGDTPNSQAEPTPKKQPPQTPAALRAKGSGEEGKDSHSRQWRLSMAVFLNRNKRPLAAPIEVAELLPEKRPPPQNLAPTNLFGREREGGASLREAASLAFPQSPHFPRFFSFADLSASAAGMIFFVSVDDAARFFRLPPLRLFTLAAAAFKSNSCCQFCCASSSCCA